MSGATEILPGLWLGDTNSAHDNTFITDKQIQCIINCSDDPKFPNESTIEMKYYLQSKSSDMVRVLDDCSVLIKNNIKKYNILVYYQTCDKYGVIIILMYLMKYGEISLSNSIELIKTKRPDINEVINNNLLLLKNYQKLISI